MLIDNESIIILGGEVCKELLLETLKLETVQSTETDSPKENCFIRNSSVIQCINPSVNDGNGKLKLSVMYKPAGSGRLKYAAVIFSHEVKCIYEIRSKNETAVQGECSAAAIKITPSDEPDKLSLEFIVGDEMRSDSMISEINALDEENISVQSEINSLEDELAGKKMQNAELLSRKDDIAEKLEAIKNEIEELSVNLNEFHDITNRRDTLKKNFEENSENYHKAMELKEQLSVYSDILDYYKTDDGFKTVSERLAEIVSEIGHIENDIAFLAEKRADETKNIADELNI